MPPVPSVSPFLWMRATSTKKSKKGAVCPDKLSDSEASPEELLQNMKEANSVILLEADLVKPYSRACFMYRYLNKCPP